MSSWRIAQLRRLERMAMGALRNQSMTYSQLHKRDLRALEQMQRSPALSDMLERFQAFCSKPPKGFEKFFKDKPSGKPSRTAKGSAAAEKEAPKDTKGAAQSKSKDSGTNLQFQFKFGSGGGKGGGFGQMPDSDKEGKFAMAGMLFVGALALYSLNQMKYRWVGILLKNICTKYF